MMTHLMVLAWLLVAAFLGNVLAKQVRQRYLLPQAYRRQAVLTALLAPLAVLAGLIALFWHNQAGILVLIDVAVLYAYYLYSSFAHAPQAFQNQDVLRFLKIKS